VRGEHQDARPLDQAQQPPVRQLLELGVANGDPLVHQEDVGVDGGGRGEGQPGAHAGRVGLHRHGEEGAQAAEFSDLVHPRLHLAGAHAGDAAADAQVLEAGDQRVDAER